MALYTLFVIGAFALFITTAQRLRAYAVAIPSPEKQADVSEEEIVPLRVFFANDEASTGALPFLVALHMGFFEKAGFSPKYVQSAEDADISIIGRSNLYQNESKVPGQLKVISFTVQEKNFSNDALVVPIDSSVGTIRELPGSITEIRHIGGGPACKPLIEKILSDDGYKGDIGAINIIPSDALPDKNDWQVAYMREPFLTNALADSKVKVLLEGPLFADRYFSPWLMAVTVLKQDFIVLNPEQAIHIAKALDEATAFINTHPQEAQAILSSYGEGKFGFPVFRERISQYRTTKTMPLEYIVRQIQWYFDNGIIARKPDAASLYFTQ